MTAAAVSRCASCAVPEHLNPQADRDCHTVALEWLQPEEEEAAGNYEEDDEDELPEVPPMPFIVPKTPVEQAGVVLHEKQAFAQQLINTALQVLSPDRSGLRHAVDPADLWLWLCRCALCISLASAPGWMTILLAHAMTWQ